MKNRIKISEAEWNVLKIVWQHPASAASDIVQHLTHKKSWNHRTVKTLLARLVKKGVLATEQDGNRYLYHAKLSQDELIKQESQSFMQRVFDGFSLPLLAHFVKTTPLSNKEIQELKQLLDQKKDSGKNASDN